MYVAHDMQRPICDGEFSPTFSIFCKHISKFICHPICLSPAVLSLAQSDCEVLHTPVSI